MVQLGCMCSMCYVCAFPPSPLTALCTMKRFIVHLCCMPTRRTCASISCMPPSACPRRVGPPPTSNQPDGRSSQPDGRSSLPDGRSNLPDGRSNLPDGRRIHPPILSQLDSLPTSTVHADPSNRSASHHAPTASLPCPDPFRSIGVSIAGGRSLRIWVPRGSHIVTQPVEAARALPSRSRLPRR